MVTFLLHLVMFLLNSLPKERKQNHNYMYNYAVIRIRVKLIKGVALNCRKTMIAKEVKSPTKTLHELFFEVTFSMAISYCWIKK